MRAIFRSATVCLVLGESWRVFLRQELGLARSRTVVLRNGVPLPAVRRVAAEAPFGFVFVGNLLARKGLVDLLHAAADARLAEHNWRLIIAGGGDTTRLRTLVATLGIGSRVAFTGWLGRADTSHILAQAGALVLPSYLEALPLVLAEAASLGVPIVATPVGAIGEIFEDGLTALLVAPGDRLALAAAMLRLVTEPALSARLGRGGRAVYERTLTLDRFVDGLMGVYAGHCQAAPARAAAS
jgi:glycosyltransferase involved in cell wall biosynthesis